MAYQTALTIAEVINDIHRKKYLLPAIQREFVWNTNQIERLFDSLMRNYPISSFLFWGVDKEKVNDFEFYEFLRQYHERKQVHNPKASVSGEEGVTAVLDGQQRLTSLYIALKGTYAYKIPRKRWDNDQAYPERKLHLNILSSSTKDGREFDFKFLTAEEAAEKNETTFWFPVPKILDLKGLVKINQFLIENGIFSNYSKEAASFANKALSQLYEVIHVQLSISYFLEKSQELDKVLNIFIRINSGGTVLSYSDLLLSIATAQWEEKDAREEITKFVDEINNIRNGFNFNKDFVLKSCLILSDFADIAFKVDNFNKTNMLAIEANWDKISNAIRLAVKLVASYGYSRETLVSNNAVIPIAYYIFKKDLSDSFVSSDSSKEDRKAIKQWLVLSLTKRAFSGQPDNVLRPIRKIIKDNINSGYPTSEIIAHFKGTNKTLVFTSEDIDGLLAYQYGQSYTFSVLSLIYPSLDYRNVFHLDHIYPKSLFTRSKLLKASVEEDQVDEYTQRVNRLANLQLLEAIPNIEKSDRPFDIWLGETYSSEQEQNSYKEKHLISKSTPIGFLDFTKFFEAREYDKRKTVEFVKRCSNRRSMIKEYIQKHFEKKLKISACHLLGLNAKSKYAAIFDDSKPVHPVSVKAFLMSETEVTIAQYRKCVEAGRCTEPNRCDSGNPNWTSRPSDKEDHPIICVNWEDAGTFAKWAGADLPTEAQWEYAARGGEHYKYAGSDDLDEVAWHDGNSGSSTHAVKTKKPNGYGLH